MFSTNLGNYRETIEAALGEIAKARIVERIWAHDHTVWKPDPEEITNRLGWLHSPQTMVEHVGRLEGLADSVRGEGYTDVLLLGMGGSSLAPGVFRKTFGVKEGYLDLAVLDSTDPGAVLGYERRLDLAKTLFAVATKSGGTAETLSFFKYFYNKTVETLGAAEAGAHFIAITDPGSRLVDIASQHGFRDTFLNDPNIGGRYSALSYFGLVAAALVGVDLGRLLDRAQQMADDCQREDNSAARLGVIMGELAKAGRDKVTLFASPPIASFGDWVEQLIAESTGKNGKGILPVVGEPVGAPDTYRDDRLFVCLNLGDDTPHEAAVQALEEAGHPVVRLQLDDVYDLGRQFFLWEMATAIAGERIGIQPFNQPNVEAAKVLARQMIAAYKEKGKLPELTPALESGGITVYGDVTAESPGEALDAFLDRAEAGAYIALQAYVTPGAATGEALQAFRALLRERTRRATTLGYGPRFLHSTGQLHKGDAGRGLFIQLTSDAAEDADIPDEAGKPGSSMSFGVLKLAQALGDRQALLDVNRQVIRFHLGTDVVGKLGRLADSIS
jgi:transaldolase/glucose-6-phosphate isomerase